MTDKISDGAKVSFMLDGVRRFGRCGRGIWQTDRQTYAYHVYYASRVLFCYGGELTVEED